MTSSYHPYRESTGPWPAATALEFLGEDKTRQLADILRQVRDAGGKFDDKMTPLVDELRKVGEQKKTVKDASAAE